MTRDDAEAALRRNLTGLHVPEQYHNAIAGGFMAIAEDYAAELTPHHPRRVLHHTSGTDLYPVIAILAEALLGTRRRQP